VLLNLDQNFLNPLSTSFCTSIFNRLELANKEALGVYNLKQIETKNEFN